MAEVDARPCQVKRVLCGNPTQLCWPPEDLAWNSSSTFGIAVIPPSPLVQGGLKGTCSGQWETPVTFALVHSFLLDQAAGSPQKGGRAGGLSICEAQHQP